MEFKDFLRVRRAEINISQAELAERLTSFDYETSTPRIGHWETGRNNPPWQEAQFRQALAAALEIDTNEMMSRLGFIISDDDRSPEARRAADLVDRLPQHTRNVVLDILAAFDNDKLYKELGEYLLLSNFLLSAKGILNESDGDERHMFVGSVTIGVFENAIRTLFQRKIPASYNVITLMNLGGIIDELIRTNVISSTSAIELYGYIEIRNKMIQGLFNQLSRNEVEQLLDGVQNFLDTYFAPRE